MKCSFKDTGRGRKWRGVEERLLQCEREGCGFRCWSADPPERTHHACRATVDVKAAKKPCGKKSRVPKWMRMGFDFAAAIGHWAAEGFPTVSQPVYNARAEVCNACSHKTKTGQCDVCNCFVAAKAALETEDCPLGKWT